MPAYAAPDLAERVAALVEGVAARGYAVVPQFLPPDAVAPLREHAEAAFAQARMRPAGIGRADGRMHDAAVRGDATLWLDDDTADPPERRFLATLESVRLAANAALFLGLFDFEGHYARYPEGASYARHRDRFRDQDRRTLTLVLYLNDAWPAAAGGALRLYRDECAPLDVRPEGGTAVAFLADRFEHEVLPASMPRWSFTGWFRRRAR